MTSFDIGIFIFVIYVELGGMLALLWIGFEMVYCILRSGLIEISAQYLQAIYLHS